MRRKMNDVSLHKVFILICFGVLGANLWNAVFSNGVHDWNQRKSDISNDFKGKKPSSPHVLPPISKPILVVGLPKSGTTTISEFFTCGGFKTSHWRCRTRRELCGDIIRQNVNKGLGPLQNTGDYEVYAQLDGDCYFPQIAALNEIHEFYPDATFVLNLRNITRWMKSVRNFYPKFKGILKKYRNMRTICDISERESTDEVMNEYYENHTKRIRDFVALHPSHRLVEVHIDDENAGALLGEAFNISASCWGQHNVNIKNTATK